MKCITLFICSIIIISCSPTPAWYLAKNNLKEDRLTGSAFYEKVNQFSWKQRDSLAITEILLGNYPDFIRKFVPIESSMTDSNGVTNKAIFYVTADYVLIGTNKNWARVPLTPMAAQQIADSLHCFLPTKKMVDLIYEQAIVKLEPKPLTQNRDSSTTMFQHHKIIEEQRNGRKGLIAGIKKDIILTQQLLQPNKAKKVAIYGWHQLNGKPIQPIYTGHVNWYVDYSHGIRLIARKIIINGKAMDYKEVLSHPVYSKLICDEADCTFLSYGY